MTPKFPSYLFALASLGAALIEASDLQAAEFYPITSVTNTNSSEFFATNNLIQGSGVGFDAAEPHDQLGGGGGGFTWVTDAAFPSYYDGFPAPVLWFDLGADVALTEISTWGYADSNTNGARDISLRFATEAEGTGAFGTSITYNPTFEAGFNYGPRDSNEFSQTVNARYVEVTMVNNWQGLQGGTAGGDRVGLGEIAFENAVIPDDPTISVPAAIELSLSASIETEDIPVANKGMAVLNITGTNFTGTNMDAFSTTSVPASIAGTSSDIIQIQFDPAGLEGPISATLQIMSNDPSTPTAEVMLTGTVPPAAQNIIVSDPVIDRTLAATKTYNIPVENDGGTVLTISGTSLTGPNASTYNIVSAPATVDPVSIENIEVEIDPSGLEGLLSATLQITSDDPDTPVVDVLIEAVALGDTAEFFPISATTASTSGTDLWPVSNLIQGPGVGFDSTNPYTKLLDAAEGNWVTDAPGGFPSDFIEVSGMPVLTFDLGEDVPLGEISLWGYSTTNSNGLSEFSLRFATAADGADGFGTSIPYNPTFGGIDSGEFPNEDNTSRFSFPFEEGAFARYVELTCVDNFFIAPGDNSLGNIPGGDRVGIGEVAFSMLTAPGGALFAVTSIVFEDGNVTFTWNSRPGADYSVWRSTDLRQSPWEELTDSWPSGGDETTFVDDDVPAGAPRVFYQVRPGL